MPGTSPSTAPEGMSRSSALVHCWGSPANIVEYGEFVRQRKHLPVVGAAATRAKRIAAKKVDESFMVEERSE